MPKRNLSGKNGEPRFQWSMQRSVKVKAIPWIVSELKNAMPGSDPMMMEDRFNFKHGIIIAVGVADNQRPFMRTLDFIKNDLAMLNEDYSLRDDYASIAKSDLLKFIYAAASRSFIPFQTMTEVFRSDPSEIHLWNDFKTNLSREMIMKAKNNFPEAFRKKNTREMETASQGVYAWRIDDSSLNRLVEFAMLFGQCSFVVLEQVRFLGFPKWEEPIVAVDFDELTMFLKKSLDGFNPTTIYSIDQIYSLTNNAHFARGSVVDALLSGRRKKMVQFFIGGDGLVNSITVSGETHHRVRFTEECFL